MKIFYKGGFFSTLILLCADLPVKAQSINGDTVYVNTKVEVAVRFPTRPTNLHLNPTDAQYNIKTLTSGISVSAKSNKATLASLSVEEGKRTHQFFLVYKKNIDYTNPAETDFNYTTVKIIEEHNRQKEAQLDTNNKYLKITAEAKTNLDHKNYAAAQDGYKQALLLKPNDPYASRQLQKVSKLLDAENRKKEKLKPKINTTELTADPQYYSAEELKSKYPGIDFTKLPPGQQYNPNAFDWKKNTKTFNKVLAENPRLDINDKSHKVKLICQGLNFEEKAVYLKLLIQNNSKNDFLTGVMMLTLKKGSGDPIRFNPMYIHPAYLPVVKPGKEAVIIYICQPSTIADDDKLKFELNDRLNKIKLELSFKGSVYNEELRR